ncbi:flagellar biosynthetic protein FliR [Candidatus Gastranaerophilus sp. (ex Termes propinquus)]|nr:flagellar biosynthetic protein FliR [Candidatus Gastranaerophilus sp. (ex Termes propinquus)]
MTAEPFIAEFAKIFPEINLVLSTGTMVFIRLLGLMVICPPFNRKEVPGMVKICLATIMCVICTMVLKPTPMPSETPFILCMFLNFAFGMMLGFIVNCVLAAVSAGGDMMNMQMGKSAATVLDPTTRAQVSIIGNIFGYIALIIFISSGGAFWAIDAFLRSFEVFGMYSVSVPIEKLISMDYLTFITSNVLYMGMQIASPIILATLGQDIILGIISKTAPQVNVFQLSFLFKPVVGVFILITIMPLLINVINDYISEFAQIF